MLFQSYLCWSKDDRYSMPRPVLSNQHSGRRQTSRKRDQSGPGVESGRRLPTQVFKKPHPPYPIRRVKDLPEFIRNAECWDSLFKESSIPMDWAAHLSRTLLSPKSGPQPCKERDRVSGNGIHKSLRKGLPNTGRQKAAKNAKCSAGCPATHS